MINDTRKGAKWTGEESPVYCGWHLILQKSLSQLHTANVSLHFNNAFSLLNINSEVLTRLQNMPVNKAKTLIQNMKIALETRHLYSSASTNLHRIMLNECADDLMTTTTPAPEYSLMDDDDDIADEMSMDLDDFFRDL